MLMIVSLLEKKNNIFLQIPITEELLYEKEKEEKIINAQSSKNH